MSTSYTAARLLLFRPCLVMRHLAYLWLSLFALAGCPSAQLDAAGFGNDNGSGTGGAAPECGAASDCAFAAAKCCDCPTYAAPRSDPGVQACLGVSCPQPTSCPANVAVACTGGRCELACAPLACAVTCADGFALDANGCLSCDCAQVGPRACLADADCVETPADCCGCVLGGRDTAVPADQLAGYQAGLGCPPNPSCPGTSTCDAGLQPACVTGGCALVPALPAGACGRDDLPGCPPGQVCMVNSPGQEAATDHAVGVCALP